MPHKDPEAARAYKQKRYLEHRSSSLAKSKAYREENREKVNLKTKEWHDAHREHMQQWRKDNRDKLRASAKAWRLANPERIKEIKRNWRLRNLEKVKAQAKASCKRNAASIRDRNSKYQRANPDKCSVWRKRCYAKNPEPFIEAARKRAGRIKDQGEKLSRGLAKRMIVAQNFKCVLCPADLRVSGYHRDHIVALANGGRHEDANIQLLCPTCNLRKGTK